MAKHAMSDVITNTTPITLVHPPSYVAGAPEFSQALCLPKDFLTHYLSHFRSFFFDFQIFPGTVLHTINGGLWGEGAGEDFWKHTEPS